MIFVADSHRILGAFPRTVRRHVGYALYKAQIGDKHIDAKPLRNLGPGVLDVSSHYAGTFRSVYTVRLETAVYVLHAFQKKARHGIEPPGFVMDLVKQRLQRAIEIDRERRN